jgi:hypothetical protein
MKTCPSCGGPVVGHGIRAGSALAREAGRITRVPATVRRYRCDGCGQVHSDAGAASQAATEAVVDAVFLRGFSGAASALGCDRSTIGSVFRNWCDAEARALPACLPDTVGIHLFDTRNSQRIVVADLVEGTVVAVFDTHMELEAWLGATPGTVTLAAIGLDPRSLAIIRAAFPRAVVVMAPSMGAAVITEAGRAALSAIARQGAARGRNFREDPALLDRPDAWLGDDGEEELKAWSPAAKAVRRAVLDLTAALAEGSGFADVARGSSERLRAASAPPALAAMLLAWGPLMEAGTAFAWLDAGYAVLLGIGEEASRLRARPETEPLRALLLFGGGPDRDLGATLEGVRRYAEAQAAGGYPGR